jgi:hypothetical protein
MLKSIRVRRAHAAGVLALFTFVCSLTLWDRGDVQAAVVCTSTTQVAQETERVLAIDLSADQLVWATPTAIRRYDLAAQTVHIVAEISPRQARVPLVTAGDFVAWIFEGAVYRQQISTATGTLVRSEPAGKAQTLNRLSLDTNGNLLYARRMPADAPGQYRLWVFNAATMTNTLLSNTARANWDLDAGRAVYSTPDGLFLYTMDGATTTRLARGSRTTSAAISGRYVVYQRPIAKERDGFQWTANDVYLYDLDATTTPRKRLTDAGLRTFLLRAWVSGDTVAWKARYGLGIEQEVSLYTISTGETEERALYYSGNALQFDDRFVGTGDYDPFTELSLPTVYDRLSNATTTFQPDGFNSGWGMQIAGGRLAWVATQYEGEPEDYTLVASALYVAESCAASPNIIRQSQSADVFSDRPATLTLDVRGDAPLTIQWYQGALGDTSGPVGDGSAMFITPGLTAPTTYWARATNPYGSTDSAPITLSPSPQYQLVRNGGFESPIDDDTDWDDFWLDDGPLNGRLCSAEAGAPVAHEGDCAFRFKPAKGSFGGRLSNELYQDLAPPLLVVGDRLRVSGHVQLVKGTPRPFIALEVVYNDATPDTKIMLRPTTTGADYLLLQGEALIASPNIAWIEIAVGHTGRTGTAYIDAVSVEALPGGAAIPLPGAPAELRGGN